MSYSVPTFNLTCNFYTANAPPPGAARASSLCNLALGKRVSLGYDPRGALVMALLLPKGTDVRGPLQATPVPDFVEVPAGTGRFYIVENVDDIGRGFSNEHRVAFIRAVTIGLIVWPTPIP